MNKPGNSAGGRDFRPEAPTGPRSEDEVLELLDSCFDPAPPSLRLGRGDDCAEFSVPGLLALSTDLFLEDEHFRLSYFQPEEIGYKALAVNLSDLAAAGALPLAFSLGLICPRRLDKAWLRRVFQGMAALAGEYDLALSGGDISAGDKLGFCISIWGAQRQNGRGEASAAEISAEARLLRRGAIPGQELFVLGPADSCCLLGLPRLGLFRLESGGREAEKSCPGACAALLRPRPQVEAGLALASLPRPASVPCPLFVMDVSDGLARDLPRLLRGTQKKTSTPGADLDFSLDLLHPELRVWAEENARTRKDRAKLLLEAALAGGEEYVLLGAAAPELLPSIREAAAGLPVPARLDRIGRVTGRPGLRWQGRPLEDVISVRAFDHFGVI
ncbi:MAG: thiamine-phosphate kinase [Deltaproteobacteria bacterium]|jgi:thiamine-monophosphate kinase|nr:thiamine-phosphate kinase [Deltaproteobacteria bacterium]